MSSPKPAPSASSASAEPTEEDPIASEDGTEDEFHLFGSKKMKLQLNVSRDYVKSWNTKDAFRELYQNWRDAIVQSFPSAKTFSPEYQENSHMIRVKLAFPAPASSENHNLSQGYMGFIQFSKKSGTLVIVNANANLQPKHFQLGHERDCANGRLGEGLKLAIVVMILAGYRVRIEASGHSWNFSSCGKSNPYFLCTINSSRRKDVLSDDGSDAMPNLTSRISKDVAIIFETGQDDAERKLQRNEFLDWLGIVFGIKGFSRPTGVVKTQHGYLITDKEYRTRIYVKGLLCQRRHGLVYGYNLHHAGFGRGAQNLVDDTNQPKLLCNLWEAAIQKRPAELLPIYIDLLRDPQEPLDVKEADRFLDKSTAQEIWNHLVLEAKDRSFYYLGEDAEDIRIIKDCIKKEPVLITDILWNILRQAELIRTPKEEQIEQFRNAEETASPDSAFPKTLQRMLKSTLALNEATQDIVTIFVNFTDDSIQAHYDSQSNVLKISKSWLDFHTVHAEYPCMIYRMNPDTGAASFFCDHIFENLYEIVIKAIFQGVGLVSPKMWKNAYQAIREKALEMPRDITIKPGLAANQLVVSWTSGMSQQALNKLKDQQYHVILHDEQCTCKADMVLHEEINMSTDTLCQCVQQTVPCNKFVATFDNLDPSKAYFPMIAWDKEYSFYGLPPEPIKPSTSSASKGSNISSKSPESLFTVDNAKVKEDNVMHIDEQDGKPNIELERDWKQWEKEVFPRMFSSLTNPIPSYESTLTQRSRLLSVHESRRLNWRFEKDDYVMVTMRFQSFPERQGHFILYTHGISLAIQTDQEDEGVLLCTLYSVMAQDSVLRQRDEIALQSDAHRQGLWLSQSGTCELMLHFKEFKSMGSWHDGSQIPIQWIDAVYPISSELLDTLQYTTEFPPDITQPSLFCLFAHRSDGPGDTVCVTPVASHLLPHSKRWINPRYGTKSNPVVLDLSPGVVGLAEGFHQCRLEIYAGLGFDPAAHLTWKAAHGSAFILDGTLNRVLSDIKSNKLNPLRQVPQDTPCIAILCIADKRLSDVEQMRRELGFLDYLQDILALQPRLDFLVLIFPPWILYNDLGDCLFNKATNKLLEKRYCVHLKKVSLASHGITRDEPIIILLGSSVYSPIHWKEHFDSESEAEAEPIAFDQIRDLTFCNPRTTDPTAAGFLVCKHPTAHRNVYNHQTGLALTSPRVLNLEPLVTMTNATLIRHPERNDRLTVRELARIQGFDDDFLFLGSTQQQYENVTRAFPPPIAKKIGLVIMDIIREFQSGCVGHDGDDVNGEAEDAGRGQKRKRMDEA